LNLPFSKQESNKREIEALIKLMTFTIPKKEKEK
tara:strand:+ start:282 stop:383 length:102 start_codon:yes stop_codon:yes gene_type:complete